ncbi:flagellar hook-basal body complex protein FliE [Aquabacterium sp. A7-Y]|uniref:flagellar hook-basal body complex protein FliE n=1 Tax=Aquabacterium sp. A7-Y TaxID=1349605 RepID=UPI00223E7DFE|nr:flagellar hook-basal body complex protein FliE [Aquabacterium sp. A7-Y]MCW7536517.1 flagellar hook-basal body complex protein FliE [Aquabacterium sp. A7-Y]
MNLELGAWARAAAGGDAGLSDFALPQAPRPAAMEGDAATGSSFMDSLKNAVQSVDAQDRAASDKMAAVDAGRSDDLVGAMLASQEASLSFSMLTQLRNKVVGAMDELIKLQL